MCFHVSHAHLGIVLFISFTDLLSAAVFVQSPTSFPTASPQEYIIGDEEMTFEDAEDWCITQGSHLVSIHSDAEMEEITAICSEDCWIGGNCVDNGLGSFEYTDGTVWGNYTNWYFSGPASCIHDHCVYLYSEGLWKDADCDEENYPLCNPVVPTSGNKMEEIIDCSLISALCFFV